MDIAMIRRTDDSCPSEGARSLLLYMACYLCASGLRDLSVSMVGLLGVGSRNRGELRDTSPSFAPIPESGHARVLICRIPLDGNGRMAS